MTKKSRVSVLAVLCLLHVGQARAELLDFTRRIPVAEPVDVLVCGGGFVNKVKKPLATPIPFRAMVPQGAANLLCAGRSISVERDVLGPLREMAPCMAMGEAAGVASAQLVRGTANADVDTDAVRAELRKRGCIVDREKLPVIRPRVDPPKTARGSDAAW